MAIDKQAEGIKEYLQGYLEKAKGWAEENPQTAGAIGGGLGGAALGTLSGGRENKLRNALIGAIGGAGVGYAGGSLYDKEKKDQSKFESHMDKRLLKTLKDKGFSEEQIDQIISSIPEQG